MEVSMRLPLDARWARRHRRALRLRHRSLDDLPDAVGCGRDGGHATGPFEDAVAVMAAADGCVTAHVSASRRDTSLAHEG
jgi:hypothetical protein